MDTSPLYDVLFGMVGDAIVGRMEGLFPYENLVWGSDFPHSVGTYPNSQQYLKDTFGHLDDELRQRILCTNIARHLGLDPDAEITPTPDA